MTAATCFFLFFFRIFATAAVDLPGAKTQLRIQIGARRINASRSLRKYVTQATKSTAATIGNDRKMRALSRTEKLVFFVLTVCRRKISMKTIATLQNVRITFFLF